VASLFNQEAHVWTSRATTHGLDACLTTETLRNLIVFMMLTGAPTAKELHQLVPLVPGLEHSTAEQADRLNLWLHLYPRQTGYWTRPHLPALLAEHLIADAIANNTDLAAAIALTADTPEGSIAVLTTVARATTHTTTGTDALRTLLGADFRRLTPLAIRLALADHPTADRAIADAIDEAPPDWTTALALDHLLPNRYTHRQVLIQTRIAVARARVKAAPDNYERGSAQTDLAYALDAAAAIDEAVTAAKAAVEILDELAAAEPTAYRPSLAFAQRTLCTALYHVGRFGEAVTAAKAAVEILDELAAAEPTAYRPSLAVAQRTLSMALRHVGRFGEAVTAAKAAVEILDELAAAYRPSLGDAQRTLSEALRHAERFGEAVTAGRAAVEIFDELAAAEPTAYRAYLAEAQRTLSDVLRHVGRPGEAVTAGRAAVEIFDELAAAEPTAYRPSLAFAQRTLCTALYHAGRFGEAVTAAKAAVEILDELAAAEPTAYRPYLADAQRTLNNALHEAGHSSGGGDRRQSGSQHPG
jgi:tetratricopeptide (TPR) repeat protein